MQLQWNWWGGQLKFDVVVHFTCKKWRSGDKESHLMAWRNLVEPLPPAHNQHLQQPWLLPLEEWYCFTHSNPLVKYIWPCSEEEENLAGASSLFLLLHLTTHFCSAGFCLWLSLWQFFHIVWVWSLHNRRTGMVAPQESWPPCNSIEQDASQSINKVWNRKAVLWLCYIFSASLRNLWRKHRKFRAEEERGEVAGWIIKQSIADQLVLQFPGPGNREEEGQGWPSGHP